MGLGGGAEPGGRRIVLVHHEYPGKLRASSEWTRVSISGHHFSACPIRGSDRSSSRHDTCQFFLGSVV